MQLTDFLIIYLACGAPFGAYYAFTSREHSRNYWFYLKLAVNFIVWPQYAIRLLGRRAVVRKFFDSRFDPRVVRDFERDCEINEIRRSLEIAGAASDPEFGLFSFRESFDRYVGLSIEISENSGDLPAATGEFAEISGKGRNEISERCLQRKNLRNLVRHRDRARIELLLLIDRMNLDDETTKSASSIGRLVGDEESASIAAPFSHSSTIRTAAHPASMLDRAA
jgi:hypothetical protein